MSGVSEVTVTPHFVTSLADFHGYAPKTAGDVILTPARATSLNKNKSKSKSQAAAYLIFGNNFLREQALTFAITHSL